MKITLALLAIALTSTALFASEIKKVNMNLENGKIVTLSKSNDELVELSFDTSFDTTFKPAEGENNVKTTWANFEFSDKGILIMNRIGVTTKYYEDRGDCTTQTILLSALKKGMTTVSAFSTDKDKATDSTITINVGD
ncbi:MAG: hypothetical protein ACOYK6_04080 [Chthoniobacterales bacterium]